MNQAYILGFPNQMPHVHWQTGLPRFQDKGDYADIHLMSFHFHVHNLGIDFPEDCLTKMFMLTLEENARFWYETRPPASICSLKDFYLDFCKKYNRGRPSEELIQNLCGNIENLMLYLGAEVDDEGLINEEIKEAPLESDCQSSCTPDMLVSQPWIQEEHV